MKLGYDLNLMQTQKLVLTPELRQAIEILQYNSLELGEYIKNELLSNPLLETAAGGDKFDIISKNLAAQNEKIKYTPMQEEADEYDPIKAVPMHDSLKDHLMFQLQFAFLEDLELELAKFIIETVDDNGYIEVDEQFLKKNFKVDEQMIENVIITLQTFEPHGVCSRSVQECLENQLRIMGYRNELPHIIVRDYLEDLAANRLSHIAKCTRTDIVTVQKAVDIIRKLEPKPGRMYSGDSDTRYVRPDVFVRKEKGKYEIILSEYTAPSLCVSKYYSDMLKDPNLGEEVTTYIHGNINSALRLIKSIEQRRSTIYKVVEAILKYQEDFFEKGKMYLKKMKLMDIAQEIGVHESTVSRAINGKYMQSFNGVFELKYFFQSGVESHSGEGVSAMSIKETIKDLVSNEDPKMPLSDQDISNELNIIGIKISRRTIAKYRDELNIPSSSKRKRF